MQGEGVHAAQFQQWEQISQKMINDVRATEEYLVHKDKLYCCIYGHPQPNHSQQKAAHPTPHDGHIVKKLTDGHGAVIGHHSEKDDAHFTKEVLSKELEHAALQGDGSALREEVYNHLAGNDRRVGSIQKGLKGNEKIHG